MEKLKETVLKLANSDPNNPLSPSQISFIEQKLLLVFPVLHTPSHPTYAAMIQNAIEGLNEENGSNEESISEYIKANYDDLPWAHSTYLSHHLSKLCENGEIVCTLSTDKFYTTPALALMQEQKLRKKPAKQSLSRKMKESVIKDEEEDNAGGEIGVRVGDNLIEVEEDDVLIFKRSKVNSRRRSLAVVNEDEVVGGATSVVGEQNVITNSQMMMDTQNEITTSAAELKLAPVDCVEESLLNLTNPSESNIRDDAHELVVKESGLKESELMVVLPERDPHISSEKMCLTIVCGLEEPSLPALAVDSNLVEHDPLHKLSSWRGFEAKVVGMESEMGPLWLMPMLKGSYFFTCSHHGDSKKSECNMFCLDCMGDAFCQNCLPLHNVDHRILQIRKSLHHNALRVEEIQRHLDISGIQTYTINSARIVFLNARPQPKSKRGTHVCEFCHRSLLRSSRFCSLGCKLYATLLKSPNLKESQEACTSSMLKDGFNEQLDKQKNLDPSCTISLEDLMSVEDEEDLPLQKVFSMCGRRKKDAEQLFTSKAPSATEASSKPATNLILEETASMFCRIDEIKSHELESEGRIVHSEVKPSEFVEGQVESDNLQSQQEKHQEQPINESPLSKQFLQNPKHQIEGQEGQSQNDVGLKDLEAPAATFQMGTAFQKGEQETKELKRKHRGSSWKQLEISKQDTIPSSNELLQQQEGPSNSATHQNLKQKKKQLKRDREERPQKGGIDGVITDSLNSQDQQQSKQPKKGRRGRPRKQLEATKEDTVALSNSLPKQQEGLYEAAIGHHSQLQIKQPKKNGRGRPRKLIDAAEEDKPASSNLYLKSQEGSGELVNSQHPLQQVKLIKKDGQGWPWKQIEGTKDDAETSSNLHLKLQDGLFRPETDQESQLQTKKLKKDGRGRPRKQLEVTMKEAAASSNLPILQEEKSFELATNQVQQPIKQLTKGCRGRPRKQIEGANQLSLLQVGMHKKDGRGRPKKQIEGAKKESAASMVLLLQEDDQPNEDGQGRSLKQRNIDKEDSAALSSLPHKVEEQLSHQEKEHKVGEGSNGRPEKSQSDVHGTTKTGQEMPLSDDGTHQRLEKQNLEGEDQLPEARAMTIPSDNQPDHQSEEQHCDEHEVKQGNVDAQARLLKQKPSKIAATQVLLSSKYQLRSRVKSQCQDSN